MYSCSMEPLVARGLSNLVSGSCRGAHVKAPPRARPAVKCVRPPPGACLSHGVVRVERGLGLSRTQEGETRLLDCSGAPRGECTSVTEHESTTATLQEFRLINFLLKNLSTREAPPRESRSTTDRPERDLD